MAVADEGLGIAFDAGVAALKQQNDILNSIRTRASGVLAAAALVTSFGGGLGFIRSDSLHGEAFPRWAGLLLAGVVVSIGILAMAVQWPIRSWAYGLHPRLVIEEVDNGKDEDALRRDLTLKMAEAMVENSTRLQRCSRLYQVAVGLLVVEVLVFALALIVR